MSELADSLRGKLFRPGGAGYDEARAVWNGMIDRRPALIARCADVSDVQDAVRFAASHGVGIAVRGGGHNVAGTAIADGALVIDLSEMREVHIDPDGRVASAVGGATWADLDAATQAHGLATPGGVVSDTGIGGLTLGGGIGWLRRKHGLTCDNLVGAQVVTADGDVREASTDRDAELLWGLRGGGGGLGVVTRFDYELHPLGPEVFVAFVLYHADRTPDILAAYRDLTADLEDEVSSFAICGTVPDEDDFPQDIWGEPYVLLMACAATDLEAGERLVQPLRDLGDPLVDLSGPMPFVELQQILDADYPDGMRYYWKSLHLPDLSDGVIQLTREWAERRPSDLSTVDIWHLAGQMSRVDADATAFGDRSSPYLLGVEANWQDPAADADNLAWTRDCIDAFRDVSTGREYLNFPGFFEDGDRMRRMAHGDANYQRLAALRDRLDPDGLFDPSA
ncbi:MAG: FAD-binding oxidoreductase [Actinobacteria bacterium]|nr:FAD-binding oxidoreductase [Actinomycetota bacterium]